MKDLALGLIINVVRAEMPQEKIDRHNEVLDLEFLHPAILLHHRIILECLIEGSKIAEDAFGKRLFLKTEVIYAIRPHVSVCVAQDDAILKLSRAIALLENQEPCHEG